MQQIINAPARAPSTEVPDYPPELEQILMKGLALDRDERFQSTKELAHRLEAFCKSAGIAPSTIQLGEFLSALLPERVDSAVNAIDSKVGTRVTSATGANAPLRRARNKWLVSSAAAAIALAGVAWVTIERDGRTAAAAFTATASSAPASSAPVAVNHVAPTPAPRSVPLEDAPRVPPREDAPKRTARHEVSHKSSSGAAHAKKTEPHKTHALRNDLDGFDP